MILKVVQFYQGHIKMFRLGNYTVSRLQLKQLKHTFGAIQKIRVQMGGRGGFYKMTQNVTVGGGGVLDFNTC